MRRQNLHKMHFKINLVLNINFAITIIVKFMHELFQYKKNGAQIVTLGEVSA